MLRSAFAIVLVVLLSTLSLAENRLSAEQTEFFEQHVRPILAERCYHCHNSHDKDEAGLALDFRDGIRSETEHGQVVVLGDAKSSVLMQVIRHEIDDLEMPEDSGKLSDEEIGHFEKWIKMGAPDPRDEPPSAEELEQVTSWETTLEKRKKWWSLQPIRDVKPPKVDDASHPVDRFIRKQLDEAGLPSAEQADRRTLIRRLSFVLTGLPPTPEQIRAFLNDKTEDAYERLVDKMLASERFGERWARHWMDLMRYADSHGSEGDPNIPDIYRYRDYLIRAFNQDLPYDELLREHIAGDLIEEPRINEQLGINESAIGPAHWRMVFHGFAPTDPLDEKVRFTDDQINVFSKAFLGMTVSCARCHNHKFDAVSQADYYALFGVMASCRPSLRDVNTEEKQQRNVVEIGELKNEIRDAVAKHWLDSINDVREKLLGDDWKEKISNHKKQNQLFYLLSESRRQEAGGKSVSETWEKLTNDWQQLHESLADDAEQENAWRWNMADAGDYETWFRDGNGLPESPQAAGDFHIDSADRVIDGILPRGVNANTISKKHRSFMGSPRFNLDDEYNVWFRISGQGNPSVRYAVEHYPRNGTVYPIRTFNNKRWFWQKYSLKYWKGDFVHLELNTARDAPLQTRGDEKSWFGVREVVVRKVDQPAPRNYDQEFAEPIFALGEEPEDLKQVANLYVKAIELAMEAWRDGKLNDAQAILLNECILEELLPNKLADLANVKAPFEQWTKLQDGVPIPTRVPSLQESDVVDQPLFARGNHRQPADVIPRRFLEAIDSRPFTAERSGRMELADRLVDPENPLVARVMANRMWHYVFGQGIVPTPDNFGQLGEKPSHADLLDYLAKHFMDDGWSIKSTLRTLVTSATFKQQSSGSSKASEQDPRNQLLSHANVRRLDAESIRDSLMAVSGRIDYQMYGAPFNSNSDTPRRAVYVRNRRNSLDQFLEAFNAPVPFSTTGRRNRTNVPAQSLTMLNAPFVMQLSQTWGEQIADSNGKSSEKRIRGMFESAFGREATKSELESLTEYLSAMEVATKEFGIKHHDLTTKIDRTKQRIAEVLDPVRDRLLAEKSDGKESVSLEPIAAWDFEKDLSDLIGKMHGKVNDAAKVEDGALVLKGGFVSTAALDQSLSEKTLVATVQLNDLGQRGGGVISIQNMGGGVFDSIVYAERKNRRWMPGSNGFVRTDDFNGPEEKDALNQPIHVAISYDKDGTIRGYRNGQPYGKSIRKSSLQSYRQGESQVLFGCRHGDGGAGRVLRGKIFDAQLFDRALSPEEVAAISTGQVYVSDEEVLAELFEGDKKRVKRLRTKLDKLTKEEEELANPTSEAGRWARVAHALFNLKEFIYIK